MRRGSISSVAPEGRLASAAAARAYGASAMPSAASRASSAAPILPSPTNSVVALRLDQQVREEDRVVLDVGAAQVGQPRDVVERRHEVMRRAERLHFGAHRGELGRARRRREGRHVFEHGGRRQRRALGPDVVQQVVIRDEIDRARGQRRLQLPRGREPEHVAVDRHRVAALQVRGQPLDVRRRADAGELHQLDAGAGQLPLGLRPVSAVDPHAREVRRDDQRSHRSREAGEMLAGLPVVRQVLGQVGIARRHDEGGQAAGRERLPDRFDAGTNAGAAGVEDVHGGRGAAETFRR